MRVELERIFHSRGTTYVLIYAHLLNIDLQIPLQLSMVSRSHLRLNAYRLSGETDEWIVVA